MLLVPVLIGGASAIAGSDGVTVLVKLDGSFQVHARSVPVASVLEYLADQMGIALVYQGPPPRRLVSFDIAAGTPSQAVLDVLAGVGVGYAARTNPEDARIVALVVAEREEAGGGRSPSPTTDDPAPEPSADASDPGGAAPLVADSPAAVEELQPAPAPVQPEPAAESHPPVPSGPAATPDAAGNGTEGFPLLPGNYLPGGRANGQVTEWGMPDFVLPDPVSPPPVPTPPPTDHR